jgi:CHAT domain-containing protein
MTTVREDENGSINLAATVSAHRKSPARGNFRLVGGVCQNVFHFIGHGVFENNKGSIALEDQDGKYKLLDDEGFANFFLGNRNLGLAVLNSCQGAAVSENQVFAGIAPNLVRRGIPAVVAMQYSILDTTAKVFADEFYRTLALGWPIDAAIQTTRNAISIEVGIDKPDFATPVLCELRME